MKIAVILENPIEVGGGFNQAINAITQVSELAKKTHEVVIFTTLPENIAYLADLGLQSEFLNAGRMDRFDKIENSLKNLMLKIFKPFSSGLSRPMSRFEKSLKTSGVDLVYFVTHSSRPNGLIELNYITTVLDLCHRDFPEFPEVSNDGQFEDRESHFRASLPKAVAVIVASDSLGRDLARKYGVNADRMITMPFDPSPFLGQKSYDSKSLHNILNAYGIQEGYYFYPAQLWPHKNHIRILEALKYINDNFSGVETIKFVFSGGDGGAREHLKRFVTQMNLDRQVTFLGFVPPKDMAALYEGSRAIVMPTYFGPTNLPPLEAWIMKKPLVYSEHLGNDLNEAALLVNVDNFENLAAALIKIQDPVVVQKLIEGGLVQIKKLVQLRLDAENNLVNTLARFEVRRQCWT